MAKVDMWVLVSRIRDTEQAEWQGMKMVTEPESIPTDGVSYWVQLEDTDDIWIKETWNFENGRMPKRLRGSTPSHFTYDLEGKKWIYTPPAGVTWADIRGTRDAKLKDCDWIVVKHQELGTPIPQEWADYRAALRDFPVTHADVDPELALHQISYMFDPATKANRIRLGLPLETPPFDNT